PPRGRETGAEAGERDDGRKRPDEPVSGGVVEHPRLRPEEPGDAYGRPDPEPELRQVAQHPPAVPGLRLDREPLLRPLTHHRAPEADAGRERRGPQEIAERQRRGLPPQPPVAGERAAPDEGGRDRGISSPTTTTPTPRPRAAAPACSRAAAGRGRRAGTPGTPPCRTSPRRRPCGTAAARDGRSGLRRRSVRARAARAQRTGRGGVRQAPRPAPAGYRP